MRSESAHVILPRPHSHAVSPSVRARSQVEHTASGEGAWDMLNSRQYDIALVDIQLPGITGLDLSWCYQSSLAENGGEITENDTVMIACTSDLTQSQLEEHGLKDLLRKPVTMASLRHMLHKWMPRRNAASMQLGTLPRTLGRSPGSGIFSARVLAVEDCEVTAMATQCMFQEMGLWIDTASDGDIAMRMLSSSATYDLVLLDLNLPTISGYAVASWYRDHCREAERHCATIVAVSSEPDKEACAEFGIDYVLAKPLTCNTCYHVLRRWLDARAGAAGGPSPHALDSPGGGGAAGEAAPTPPDGRQHGGDAFGDFADTFTSGCATATDTTAVAGSVGGGGAGSSSEGSGIGGGSGGGSCGGCGGEEAAFCMQGVATSLDQTARGGGGSASCSGGLCSLSGSASGDCGCADAACASSRSSGNSIASAKCGSGGFVRSGSGSGMADEEAAASPASPEPGRVVPSSGAHGSPGRSPVRRVASCS